MSNYLPLPEKFTHHRELVRIVTAAGVPAPARWTELNAALDGYTALDNSAADRLAAAVVNPSKTTDLTLLRALALAELNAGPQQFAQLNHAVVAQVEAGMLTAWAEVARDNYNTIAGKFNGAAADFHAAAQAVDVEAEAAAMVAADDTTRQAWLNAAVAAAKLTELTPPLLAAAQLTGLRIDLADERIAQQWWQAPIDDAAVFGLTVDAGELHRRRAFEAFDTEGGRTGRFGPLVSLGARLRAADLDSYAPYRRPAPLIHKQRQMAGRPIGFVEGVVIDPEDQRPAVPAAEPAPATSLRKSRMTAV
jgi:hypothetical protein